MFWAWDFTWVKQGVGDGVQGVVQEWSAADVYVPEGK